MLVERGLLYRNGGGWQLQSANCRFRSRSRRSSPDGSTVSPPDEKAVLRDACGRSGAASGRSSSLRSGTGTHCHRRRRFTSSSERSSFVASAQTVDGGRTSVFVPPRAGARRRVRADPAVERAEKHCAIADVDRVARSSRGPRRDDRAPLSLALEYARAAGQDASRFAAAARTRACRRSRARARPVRQRAGASATTRRRSSSRRPTAERGRPALRPRQGTACRPEAGIAELEEASSLAARARRSARRSRGGRPGRTAALDAGAARGRLRPLRSCARAARRNT